MSAAQLGPAALIQAALREESWLIDRGVEEFNSIDGLARKYRQRELKLALMMAVFLN